MNAPLAITAYNVDPIIHDRLENWRRCYTYGGLSYGHCCSIEYRFLPESDLDNEYKRMPRPPLIDIKDAQTIERTLTHPNFPKKHRVLIINEYAYKRDYREICRKLGIRFSEYGQQLLIATNMIRNRI